ncbi:uncharacterized protein LOC131233069 [Magnolia sinica]|uniref:uncharacterized protein LOC131233069 n=1 Tax=Magnolia sinica TaxID=86752 RepID=UPI0026592198|nr:uncharacterized protein LOC131233069 [Magnolia sinica]
MKSDGADGVSADRSDLEKQENAENSAPEDGCLHTPVESVDKDSVAVISIVISRNEACNEVLDLKGNVPKVTEFEKDEKVDVMAGEASPQKGCLQRIESYHEQCRVCHQQNEEALMDLGCRCRGELAKAHRSCIDIWFHTKGSNKCEICQQVAANVPSPESQPTARYWIWRVDPAFGGSDAVQGERGRGCCNPLWVALLILIGGLLLDVLISIALGISALPVNTIIGALILLGLATVLRLALECCHGQSSRRVAQRVDVNIDPGYYHPTV